MFVFDYIGFLVGTYSSGASMLKLIGLVVLCFVIIIASYYTTKFVGGKGTITGRSTFMRPLEVIKLSQNSYLQLVQIGERYFVLAVTKEAVTVITEVDKNEVPVRNENGTKVSFKEILNSVKLPGNKNADDSEQ